MVHNEIKIKMNGMFNEFFFSNFVFVWVAANGVHRNSLAKSGIFSGIS